MRYTYHYEADSYYHFVSFYEYTSDSGSVEYIVLDSTGVDDTSSVWSVMEIRSLLHRYNNSNGDSTTFWISDSTLLTLSEFTTGLHELRCTSLSLWRFPLADYSIYETQVFRYSDGDSVLLVVRFEPGLCGEVYDSVWFSANLGLHQWRSVACWEGGLEGGGGNLSAELVSIAVSAPTTDDYLPAVFELSQNYPNPFNPTTTFSFTTPQSSIVNLTVFDLLGREVALIVNENLSPGTYRREWNATGYPSGVYFYRLRAGDYVQTNKLTLIR